MAVTKVVMPKLSEARESGKIIKWLKQEGDRVTGGDILAEIETDKADVEMEAFGGGVLRKILVKEGDRVPVGSLIAVIAEPNEDIAPGAAGAAGAAPPTTGVVASRPAEPTPLTAVTSAPGRVKASPLARKVAAQSGVGLHPAPRSGPGGR